MSAQRFACLVLPTDLPGQAIETGESSGWLFGAYDGNDGVYAPRGIVLPNDDKLLTRFFEQLFGHRVTRIGRDKDRLLPWVSVKSGFSGSMQAGTVTCLADISKWLMSPVELEEILQKHPVLCCFEVEGSGATASFVLALSGTEGESDVVASLPIEWVSDDMVMSDRLDGLVPLEQLRTKQAVVVGLGSGGGLAALDLAAAGVGALHLVDPDRLQSVNLFRHVCGRQDLGRSKVHAVADLIREHQLGTEVHRYPNDILDWADQLRALVADVDIVLGATDTVESRRLLNHVCVTVGTPLVLAATYDNARIGEVIRVLPRQSACYECTRNVLRAAGSLSLDADLDEGTIPYGMQSSDIRRAPARGLRTDVAMVAALQARVAAMTLIDPAASGASRLPSDFLVWGATRSHDFAEPFVFDFPFAAKFVNIQRQTDCPVCGSPSDALREVDVEANYASILASLES